MPTSERKTRPRQTERTRRALIAAADELFAQGQVPTVAAVAERAQVGRATAYRYFPTQEALLLEATFLGDSEALRALPELTRETDDPAEGVAEAVRRGAEWTLERETRLRMVLRASLDPASDARRPDRRAHAPLRDRPDHLAGRQQRHPARTNPGRPRVDGSAARGRGAGRVGAQKTVSALQADDRRH